jgi:lipoic acid synthetase
MILGDVCSRRCSFCAVKKGIPLPLDEEEPQRVAEAAYRLGLKYAVVTSVTRDDLADGGANHFVRTIKALRDRIPGVKIEVLTPDFQGNPKAISRILEYPPDVFNHNLETVPRLYPRVRPDADYYRSLNLLSVMKDNSRLYTKSGLMLGLGEKEEEIILVMEDLRRRECDFLTLGQYLSPSSLHHPVVEFLEPERFECYRQMALTLGFSAVTAGPFVRSSYHARQLFSLPAGEK